MNHKMSFWQATTGFDGGRYWTDAPRTDADTNFAEIKVWPVWVRIPAIFAVSSALWLLIFAVCESLR